LLKVGNCVDFFLYRPSASVTLMVFDKKLSWYTC